MAMSKRAWILAGGAIGAFVILRGRSTAGTSASPLSSLLKRLTKPAGRPSASGGGGGGGGRFFATPGGAPIVKRPTTTQQATRGPITPAAAAISAAPGILTALGQLFGGDGRRPPVTTTPPSQAKYPATSGGSPGGGGPSGSSGGRGAGQPPSRQTAPNTPPLDVWQGPENYGAWQGPMNPADQTYEGVYPAGFEGPLPEGSVELPGEVEGIDPGLLGFVGGDIWPDENGQPDPMGQPGMGTDDGVDWGAYQGPGWGDSDASAIPLPAETVGLDGSGFANWNDTFINPHDYSDEGGGGGESTDVGDGDE